MLRFRYKLSEILLIIGMALGIIIAFHILSLIFCLLNSGKENYYSFSQNYVLYNSSITDLSNEAGMFSYFVPDDREKVSGESLLCCISALKGHKELYVPMPIGDSLSLKRVVGIFEWSEYPDKLSSGSWSVEDAGKYDGHAWVGESWKPFLINKEEEFFISIDSIMYKVQGILDNTLSGGMDDKVFIYLPSCSKKAIQSIETYIDYSSISLGDVGLVVSGDEAEYIIEADKMSELLKDSRLMAMTDNSLVYLSKVDARKTYIPLILIGVFLLAFGAMNLMVISSFHFEARRSEMCIRKIFGFREHGLIRILIVELIRDFLIALICVIPIEIILALCGSDLAVKTSDARSFIIISVISFLLLLVFLLVRFIILFQRIKPEDLMAR